MVNVVCCSGIWFGIIFTLMIECALITPPVGLNIYVLQAIGKAKMSEIAKGVIPFVIIMLFTVFVIYLFLRVYLLSNFFDYFLDFYR